jgi:hypothetical protein
MENYGVPPDVTIDNTPADHAKGRDAQIRKGDRGPEGGFGDAGQGGRRILDLVLGYLVLG